MFEKGEIDGHGGWGNEGQAQHGASSVSHRHYFLVLNIFSGPFGSMGYLVV